MRLCARSIRRVLKTFRYGLDGSNYQWVDLDGEGLSGILTEQAEGWFYKRNLSPINVVQQNGKAHVEARFAPVEVVAEKPSLAALSGGQNNFWISPATDRLILCASAVQLPVSTSARRTSSWETFRPFHLAPKRRLERSKSQVR